MFREGRIRVWTLAAADAVCLCLSWAVAVCGYWALGKALAAAGIPASVGRYVPVDYLSFWPVVVAFVVVNIAFGAYHGNWLYPSVPHSPVEEFRRLFLSSAIVHVGVVAFLAFRYQTTDGSSRVVIFLSGVLVAFLAQSFRNWARNALLRFGVGQIPVLLAGGGDVAVQVAKELAGDAHAGLRIVGYCDDAVCETLETLGLKRLGALSEVVPVARRQGVRILLACQDVRLFAVQMKAFSEWFTHVEYLPTARTFPVFGARAISFGGLGGLEMSNQRQMRARRVLKRAMDMTLAALALIVLGPLFLIIPILIKLTSRGPVFYRQTRLGAEGRPFELWKFRSMHADAEGRLRRILDSNPTAAAEWSRNFKLTDDPRVTLFGRFLRKTSLDELPQLFNVFRGDMALIGPRPIVEEEVAHYGEAYAVVSSVRPGVTGLWQVSGRSDTDYSRRVALDVYSVLNWSPWMDVWILVRTAFAVLLMRGAR